MNSSQIIWAIAAVIVGYAFGALNPASMIAKARGVDIRASGSGNPGATNAGRVLGKQAGIIVAVLDILKGTIPALVFSLLAGIEFGALAGFAAVVGHMTSPVLKGHGGKGVATTLGVVLALHPWWVIPILLAFLVTFLIVRRTGISSVVGCAALVVVALIDHSNWVVSVLMALLGLLVIARHHRNIAALFKGDQSPQRTTR